MPSAKAHLTRALYRSAEALLPRMNSGAATVTPRLRRDECGVSPEETPGEVKLGHCLSRAQIGKPWHIVSPLLVEVIIQKDGRKQAKFEGKPRGEALDDLPRAEILFVGVGAHQIEIELVSVHLGQELAAELESVTFLRNEVKQREDVISERQNAIEYVQQELAAQRESVEFLRDEVARRDSMISERQNAVAFLQQELDVRRDGIAFLQDEVAKRDGVISERQNAIEFLRQELDARDVAAAAQLEGIAFLREEVAQRELALADRESKLLESEATIASLRETLRDFEIGVSRSADENYVGREGMEN